jgi:hypothetical protein
MVECLHESASSLGSKVSLLLRPKLQGAVYNQIPEIEIKLLQIKA